MKLNQITDNLSTFSSDLLNNVKTFSRELKHDITHIYYSRIEDLGQKTGLELKIVSVACRIFGAVAVALAASGLITGITLIAGAHLSALIFLIDAIVGIVAAHDAFTVSQNCKEIITTQNDNANPRNWGAQKEIPSVFKNTWICGPISKFLP